MGMTRKAAADTRARLTPWVAIMLGLATALAGFVSGPLQSKAQTVGSQPITIPPAHLPAPAVTTPAPTNSPPSSDAVPATTIAPAARSLLPTGVQILHDSQGPGIVMYGRLTGQAASATGVILAIFINSEAFDPTPSLRLVLADQDDRHAQALFTAAVHGAPVIGVVVAALSETSGDVSVFYDKAGSFAESFARMRQALGQNGGAGTVVLSPLHLVDESQISIPPGWLLTGQGMGSVELRGPLGETMSLGASLPVYARNTSLAGSVLQGPCCDPVKALQAVFPQLMAIEQREGLPSRQLTGIVEVQPVAAHEGSEAAFILGTMGVAGRPYSYFALAEAIAGFTDPWTFSLSGTSAPQPLFADEFPTLLQIWKSYSANSKGFTDHMHQALQNMSARQAMLKSTITARESAEYDAGGWDEVIRNVASSDTPLQIDSSPVLNLVNELSADTGRFWRIVPFAELK
jgi:hypothetical protein